MSSVTKRDKKKPARSRSSEDSKPSKPGASPSACANPPTKPDKPRRRSTAKEIRNEEILAKAVKGAKTTELAQEYGVSRQTISEILNSPDAKARAERIGKALENAIPHALKTVFDSIKMGDYLAARDLLRSQGALQDLKRIEITGKDGGAVEVKSELRLSIEDRIALIKGET